MSGHYDVWIREIAASEQAKVAAAIEKVLSLDSAAAESMVRAAPVCVSSDMDEASAKQVAEALRKAGAFPAGVEAGTLPAFAEPKEPEGGDALSSGLSGMESAHAMDAQRQSQGSPTSSSDRGVGRVAHLLMQHRLLAVTSVIAVVVLGALFVGTPASSDVAARVAIYEGRLSEDVSVWLQKPAHQVRGVDAAAVEDWAEALRALGVAEVLVVDWTDDRRHTATGLLIDLKGVDAEAIAKETAERLGATATVRFDERNLIVDFVNPS